MLKKILLAVGLAKAPAPIRTYFTASTLVSAPLALAYVGWKYRDKIGPLLRRAHVLPAHAEPQAV